ncbi:unnamed protein product, partial [Meganyctiphanes norvegica]
SAGHAVAVIFALLFCAALFAGGYYIKKRRSLPELSFMFRRLSQDRRISMSSTIGRRRSSVSTNISGRSRSASSASATLTASNDGTGFRFVNPTFNKTMESVDEVADSGTLDTSYASFEHVDGQRENPMYAVFQKMSPVEKQASEDTLRSRERILEAAANLAIVTENFAATIEDDDADIKVSKTGSDVSTAKVEHKPEAAEGGKASLETGEEKEKESVDINSQSQKEDTLQ